MSKRQRKDFERQGKCAKLKAFFESVKMIQKSCNQNILEHLEGVVV